MRNPENWDIGLQRTIGGKELHQGQSYRFVEKHLLNLILSVSLRSHLIVTWVPEEFWKRQDLHTKAR